MRAEHLMRLHWGEVVNGPTVTKALSQSVGRTSPRKASFLPSSLAFTLLTHPPPWETAAPPPNPPPLSLQGPSLSEGIYLESCSMSKEIVQLRELFQNISGSQWTSYLSASTTELLPSPSCPHRFLAGAHLECAAGKGTSLLLFSCLALAAPSSFSLVQNSRPVSDRPAMWWWYAV